MQNESMRREMADGKVIISEAYGNVDSKLFFISPEFFLLKKYANPWSTEAFKPVLDYCNAIV